MLGWRDIIQLCVDITFIASFSNSASQFLLYMSTVHRSRRRICRYQALIILNRTLWKHGRRATLHNVEVQAFDVRNVMDWNIFACFSYSISHPQRWKSQLVKDVVCMDDHITIYSHEKGLRVTLSSSMIKMEHHPCVSFFLLAWRQGCHISWFIAEYKASICCEELVMQISCVPLKLFTN